MKPRIYLAQQDANAAGEVCKHRRAHRSQKYVGSHRYGSPFAAQQAHRQKNSHRLQSERDGGWDGDPGTHCRQSGENRYVSDIPGTHFCRSHFHS